MMYMYIATIVSRAWPKKIIMHDIFITEPYGFKYMCEYKCPA